MKKCLVVLLLILLLTLVLLPTTASASDFMNSLTLTKNPRESINFVIQDDQLIVTNLPDNAAYRSTMVNIVNINGSVIIEKVLARSPDGTASVSLSRLSSGEYYVELYFFIGNNAYSSYIYGDELRFEWSNGSGRFKQSPAFERNKKTYEAGRSDEGILLHYLTPTDSVQSTAEVIIKLAHEITNGITDNYKKALAIHDWVCVNIWYDWDAVGGAKKIDSDALGVLNNRKAICVGYSNLMAALLQAEGIPVKLVNGYGRITTLTGDWTQKQLSGEETNHFWNEVYVNGRWVIIDATWDSGNDFREGRKSSSEGLYFSRYFDPTLEAFSIDHLIKPYPESQIPLSNTLPTSAKQRDKIDIAISYGLVPQKMRDNYTHNLTRAEFCTLAVALFESARGEEITGRIKFNDTSDTNVEKIAYLGVVNGIGENNFAPDRLLDREQAAIMISRLADVLSCTLQKGTKASGDNANVSPWAAEAVSKVRSNSIMEDIGESEFSPKGKFTREQGIIAILQLFELMK